ncbi:MAG: DUF952 domain-containing protein [Chloroflexi bacterium]|nr:DUF952 domain-containing protein [Chloroflexota bacterium]MDA1173532.1 DUF952 domain-containing protein [Chloroflexota bacterium]
MLSQDALIHVTTQEAWDSAGGSGRYFPPGFDAEGFIHCCHRSQLERVLSDHFAAQVEVLLLVLEPSQITADIRYERAANGDDYPHIYGPIQPQAVTQSISAPKVDGEWQLP